MRSDSPLRVAVLTEGDEITGWQAKCLRDVIDPGIAEIVAFIANDRAPGGESGRRPRRAWPIVPWNLLDRVEAAVAARRFESLSGDLAIEEPVPVTSFGADIPLLQVRPLTSKSGLVDRFGEADLERLRELRLDLMLRFGFGILRGDVLTAAADGIWSFHHGDNVVNRGSLPGLYEILEHQEYTGTILQRLTEDLDNGVVLRKARYVTASRSWTENRRQCYAKSARLLLDAMEELQRTGAVTPVPVDDRPFRLYHNRLYHKPRVRETVRAAATITANTVRRKLLLSRHEQVWRILVWRGPLEEASIWRMDEIVAPPGRYWADPFVIERDGEHHLFFEDFDIAAGRGHIATGRLTADGLADVTPALRPDYHLSYPFVFELDGRLHMIPESFENETIELWRCTSFPDRWERVHALMEGVSAADTTLLRRDGLWYLFTNLDRDRLGDHGEELHLYLSNDLSPGSFERHPASPVVTDAARARMGGSFQTLPDGRLLRPAQRGGEIYGTGLHFCEVTDLSPTVYRERIVETVLPNWDDGMVGIHHCATHGDVTVFDAARWEPARRHR